MVRTCGMTRERSLRMLKKARHLTHSTPAATAPARPESAKTAFSPRDAPCPEHGDRPSHLATSFSILLGLDKGDEFLVNQIRSFPLRDVPCLGDSDES